MNNLNKLSSNDRRLVKRYLTWCYKTTKEDLDRIERYYTQIQVDHFVLDQLVKTPSFKNVGEFYQKLVMDFEQYITTKKNNVDQKKYKDVAKEILDENYLYLRNRFAAIEEAIVRFLGQKALKEITQEYESEMTRRILEAREHS